jgi:regulatory protein
VPRVTALRAPRPGRVAVELDGALWRTLPLEVVVRAGLRVDEQLDRPRLRLLRRELRRHETLAAAGRVLRNRDHSVRELDRKLEQRGASTAERLGALEALERAGLVDDERFAARRARALAERGWGDAAIRVDLERRDVAAELVEQALATLDPEPERAAALVERRGGGVRAVRWLAARGFDADVLDGVIANEGGTALP